MRAEDIYNADGNLVGATAWIEETGETTVVGEDGLYRFAGVPAGNYTVHASISGYAEGTCLAELTGSQEWCSIALFPGTDEDTGGGADAGEDTGTDKLPSARPARRASRSRCPRWVLAAQLCRPPPPVGRSRSPRSAFAAPGAGRRACSSRCSSRSSRGATRP